jgi:hypothetical protein
VGGKTASLAKNGHADYMNMHQYRYRKKLLSQLWKVPLEKKGNNEYKALGAGKIGRRSSA